MSKKSQEQSRIKKKIRKKKIDSIIHFWIMMLIFLFVSLFLFYICLNVCVYILIEPRVWWYIANSPQDFFFFFIERYNKFSLSFSSLIFCDSRGLLKFCVDDEKRWIYERFFVHFYFFIFFYQVFKWIYIEHKLWCLCFQQNQLILFEMDFFFPIS